MSAVSVCGLCIRYGGNEVIKNLDLDVGAGEFLVLLGPSGCGKSTLLHSIAGLVDAADVVRGAVFIGGQDMSEADPSERGIGMVFQSYALYPTMTVERNLSFGLRVNGVPRHEIDRRVLRVATMLQLEPLLQRKPAQLSGGQRQRVAIGRALVREAQVFLLDEPLSNLDAKLRAELRRELKLLHRALGSTMIYVTHDQAEAMTLATRIVVMRNGRIQQAGSPAEVYERPANLFVAGFLGTPAMNMIDGLVSQRNGVAAFRSPALAVDLPARMLATPPPPDADVVLGLRPEHLRIHAEGAHQGRVQLVETMGNHQVIWIESGGLSLAALVHEASTLQVDDPVRFGIDAGRVSLFDRSTEARL